jgi:hypothetical protein
VGGQKYQALNFLKSRAKEANPASMRKAKNPLLSFHTQILLPHSPKVFEGRLQ